MAGPLAASRNELQTGRFPRAFSGATYLPDLDPSSQKRAPRAIVVSGACEVRCVGDVVSVLLPDFGAGFVWDLNVEEIISGDGVAVW